MADEYYAAADIHTGEQTGEHQAKPAMVPEVERETFKEGEKVKKSDFSDEEWDELVASGAVVDDKSKMLGPASTKTADVQAAAHPDAPHRTEDADEVDKAAKDAFEEDQKVQKSLDNPELTDEEREHIRSVPAGNQRHALHQFRLDKLNKSNSGSKSKTTTAASTKGQ